MKKIKTIMHMKQSMLLMAGLAMALASCQKDETISQGPSNESGSFSRSTANTIRTALPVVFTKKVLAEEFAGSGYGDVPMSNSTLANISSTFNGSVYVASFHNGDMLETGEAGKLKNILPGGMNASYPSASINRNDLGGSRFVNYGDYSNMVNMCIQSNATCGLAITSSVNGNTAQMQIMCGFNSTMTGNYTVNAYLVEDNIVDKNGMLAQTNNFNNDKTTPFFMQGNPIIGYTHNNVVRRVLTPFMGTPISASVLVPGGTCRNTYIFDIPTTCDAANCHIIAFITKLNSNGVADNICNVQKAKLGTVKGWN
ncbi:MAG: Omp28-related outer membrane protein [Bacteroidota bacterium]